MNLFVALASPSLGPMDRHDLDFISCDDFADERRLVDNKANLKLLDALAAGFEALLKSHFLLVVLIEH